MYEAVVTSLPDWPVLIPTGADEVIEWINANAIDSMTVLWLDEAQRYLSACSDELIAALDKARPLVVIGSMWPTYWNQLTSRAGTSSGEMNRQAAYSMRILLEEYRPRVSVSGYFQANEQASLTNLAHGDRRLAAALKAGKNDGKVIQHLGGGPELIERLEDGTSFSEVERAIVNTVLDADRFGHTSPISADFLAAVTAAVLPGRLRITDNPHWIDPLLHTLCREPSRMVNGGLTVLMPDRVTPGMGTADGFRPADYVAQHARRVRRTYVPSQAFWDAAAEYAATSSDLIALAASASSRGRYHVAEHLLSTASDAGDLSALEVSIRKSRETAC